MRRLRTWLRWSVAVAVLLVSPAVALLSVIAAEVLIDLLIEAGVATNLCLLTAGAIGWVLLRNRSTHAGRTRQWEEEEGEQAAMAIPPI